jgi:2-dehydro-3-deoxy-D-arabinonate dehydratase
LTRFARVSGPDGVSAARVDGARLTLLASDDPLAGAAPTGVTIDALDGETLELPEPYSLLAPIAAPEVWCAGVTYERSRDARVEESTVQDVYSLVYEAERPELFLKDAAGRRTVGPGQPIGVRSDARWNVPEPELALVLGAEGRAVAVTIGNDVSSRDIEGANPLYLPQAKVYAGACSLGPAVLVPDDWHAPFELELRVLADDGAVVYAGSTSTSRMRRSFDELVSYLLRDNPVPPGSVLLTGTGLVPPDDFTLEPGHRVEIHVPGIGTLSNPVVSASALVERSLIHV